jgi:hypothetical protein
VGDVGSLRGCAGAAGVSIESRVQQGWGWESAGKVFAFFILSIKWKSEESFDSGCDFS